MNQLFTCSAKLTEWANTVNDEQMKNTEEQTPESSSVSASRTLAMEASSLIDHNDIEHIVQLQSDIFDKLHQSQETLTSFNKYSTALYQKHATDFEKHSKMLKEMKKRSR